MTPHKEGVQEESSELELQKQLKNVKLGLPTGEMTGERGHKYRAKKQLNSTRLRFSYRDNRTEHKQHD